MLRDKEFTTYYKPGFVGGAQVNFKINEVISIQPELLYSQQGYGYQGGSGGGFFSSTRYTNYNYLQLPVLFQATSHDFFVEGGPQVGLLFRRELEAQKAFDVSAAGGIGYQVIPGLNLGARYTRSLVSVTKTYSTIRRDSKFYHQVFQLTLGYLFALK